MRKANAMRKSATDLVATQRLDVLMELGSTVEDDGKLDRAEEVCHPVVVFWRVRSSSALTPLLPPARRQKQLTTDTMLLPTVNPVESGHDRHLGLQSSRPVGVRCHLPTSSLRRCCTGHTLLQLDTLPDARNRLCSSVANPTDVQWSHIGGQVGMADDQRQEESERDDPSYDGRRA